MKDEQGREGTYCWISSTKPKAEQRVSSSFQSVLRFLLRDWERGTYRSGDAGKAKERRVWWTGRHVVKMVRKKGEVWLVEVGEEGVLLLVVEARRVDVWRSLHYVFYLSSLLKSQTLHLLFLLSSSSCICTQYYSLSFNVMARQHITEGSNECSQSEA